MGLALIEAALIKEECFLEWVKVAGDDGRSRENDSGADLVCLLRTCSLRYGRDRGCVDGRLLHGGGSAGEVPPGDGLAARDADGVLGWGDGGISKAKPIARVVDIPDLEANCLTLLWPAFISPSGRDD